MAKYGAAFPYELDKASNSGTGNIITGNKTGLCVSDKTTKELGKLLKENNTDDVSDIAYGHISGYFMSVYDAIKETNDSRNSTKINEFLKDSSTINKNVTAWLCVWVNIILASSKNQCSIVEKNNTNVNPIVADVLSEWGRYLNKGKLTAVLINGNEVAYVSEKTVICPKNEIIDVEKLKGYDVSKKRFTLNSLMASLNDADQARIKSYFENNIENWGCVRDKYTSCSKLLAKFMNDKFGNVQVNPQIVPSLGDIPMLSKLEFAGNDDVFTDYVLTYKDEKNDNTYSLIPVKESFDINKNIKKIICMPDGSGKIKFTISLSAMGIDYELSKVYDKNEIFDLDINMPFISVYPNLEPSLRKYYKKYQWTIKPNDNVLLTGDKVPNIRIKNMTFISQEPMNDNLKDRFSFYYAFSEDYPDYLHITCDGKPAGCFCLKEHNGNELLIKGKIEGYTIPADTVPAVLSGVLDAGIDFGTGNTQVVYNNNGIGATTVHKLWKNDDLRRITPLPENMRDFSRLYFVQETSDYPEAHFPTFIQFHKNQPIADFDIIPYANARIPFFNKEIINQILNNGTFEDNGIYSNLKFGATSGGLGKHTDTGIYIFLKELLVQLLIIAIKNKVEKIKLKVSYPIDNIKNRLIQTWNNVLPDVINNISNGVSINLDANDYVLESEALCKYIIENKFKSGGVALADSHMIILDLGQGTADLSYISQKNDAAKPGGKDMKIHGQMSVQFAGSRIIFDSIIKFYKMCDKNNKDSSYCNDMWNSPPDKSLVSYKEELNKKSWDFAKNNQTLKAYDLLSMLISEFGFNYNTISNDAKYNRFVSIIKFKYLILIKTVTAFIDDIIKQATQEEVKVQLLLYGGASRAFKLIIPSLQSGDSIQDIGFGKILQSVIDPSSDNLIEDGMTIEYMTSSKKHELAEGLLSSIDCKQLLTATAKQKNAEKSKLAALLNVEDEDNRKIELNKDNLDSANEVKKISFEGFKKYLISLSGKIECEIDGEETDIITHILTNRIREEDVETKLREFYNSNKGEALAYMSNDNFYPEIRAEVFYMYLSNIILNERM